MLFLFILFIWHVYTFIYLFTYYLLSLLWIEKNPTEALALLRGTIHESDRILRNWTSEQSLPPLFYYTYGSALFELGFLNEDDEEELDSYLEAAEERLQNGLDHFEEISDEKEKEKHEEVIHKIKSVLGKIWLAKVMMIIIIIII